MFKLIILN